MKRYFKWVFSRTKFCRVRSREKLQFRVKEHSSLLIRKLGESEMWLQYNKIKNLSIAIQKINGVLIKPGETFSFCRRVGLPTRKKGYVEGMEISGGEARPGIGGGICQISNLIYWLVLHSDLTVIERSHHGYDPFPDHNRTLPFGSGATVFYNYIDLQIRNDTENSYQINLWLTDKRLEGDLRSDVFPQYSYYIYEDQSQFLKIGCDFYRSNEIWRRKMVRKSGKMIQRELVTKNFARVKYIPAPFAQSQPS
jgi:vancomycin resistance protein VanW